MYFLPPAWFVRNQTNLGPNGKLFGDDCSQKCGDASIVELEINIHPKRSSHCWLAETQSCWYYQCVSSECLWSDFKHHFHWSKGGMYIYFTSQSQAEMSLESYLIGSASSILTAWSVRCWQASQWSQLGLVATEFWTAPTRIKNIHYSCEESYRNQSPVITSHHVSSKVHMSSNGYEMRRKWTVSTCQWCLYEILSYVVTLWLCWKVLK